MPGKDTERWQENADGSWSRRELEPPPESYAADSYEDETPNATAGAIEAAAELGVELADVNGTGKDGKITKADVEAAAKEE